MSIEQVASLAAQDALPVPSLDLGAIAPTASALSSSQPYRSDSTIVSPRPMGHPSYSSDDPWSRVTETTNGGNPSLTNGAPSSISGTGLPKDWWRRQERVQVQLVGMQGFILHRYMLYSIASQVSTAASLIFGLIPYVRTSSGAHLSLADTRNLSSYGSVSFDGIHSAYYLSCLRSASVVRIYS